ncbi:MAG: ATP--guanido phosphotransferase [Christensenellales bacterium]|jgi:protein arginine kinase
MWFDWSDSNSDIVLCSRARLARNLKDVPFPRMLDREASEQVVNRVREAMEGSGYHILKMKEIGPVDRLALVERHIISPQLANNPEGAVFYSPDESVAVMVNEEDHLRIQALSGSFEVDKACDMAQSTDDFLAGRLPIAYDKNFGFLTCCPTNTGTGLRISVMVHLPALTMSGNISGIIQAVGQFGMTARGLYGEGSAPSGSLYQFSNQITLGVSETELRNSVMGTMGSIMQREREARQLLVKDYGLEDKVWRAYGILTHARSIGIQEFMDLISSLKLGISVGLIGNLQQEALHRLIVEAQAGCLQKRHGAQADTPETDRLRADFVREALNLSV